MTLQNSFVIFGNTNCVLLFFFVSKVVEQPISLVVAAINQFLNVVQLDITKLDFICVRGYFT